MEIFQSSVWYGHLWRNGLLNKPIHYWLLPLQADKCSEKSFLHLVQNYSDGGLESLSNYYSCLFGPDYNTDIVTDFSDVEWSACIGILRGIPSSGMVTLQPLDSDSRWFHLIVSSLRTSGFLTFRFFCFGNWYQPVPDKGFVTYWADRPSALRNSVARGKRRLDVAGDWRIDVHTHSSCPFLGSLEDAIKAYESVYAQSWKSPELCVNFIPGLIRMAAQQGWLRLGILWFNGQPAAAQIWLIANGKANIYKLSYVQGLERLSVGSVLTAALMQRVMDIDKVLEVDYLSGDDAYKVDWMTHRRERVGIMAFDLMKCQGWYQLGRYFFRKIRLRIDHFFGTY